MASSIAGPDGLAGEQARDSRHSIPTAVRHVGYGPQRGISSGSCCRGAGEFRPVQGRFEFRFPDSGSLIPIDAPYALGPPRNSGSPGAFLIVVDTCPSRLRDASAACPALARGGPAAPADGGARLQALTPCTYSVGAAHAVFAGRSSASLALLAGTHLAGLAAGAGPGSPVTKGVDSPAVRAGDVLLRCVVHAGRGGMSAEGRGRLATRVAPPWSSSPLMATEAHVGRSGSSHSLPPAYLMGDLPRVAARSRRSSG